MQLLRARMLASNFSSRIARRHSAYALAVFLLSACATSDPRFAEAIANSRGIQSATSCCRMIPDVLAKAEDVSANQILFNAQSAHFDFGNGLAPFAVFRLPLASSVLEVEANVEVVGLVYGGDGNARYWDAQAIFLDPCSQPLDSPSPERQQKMTGQNNRSLFYSFKVPPNAAFVILTTNPKNHGTMGLGVIQGLSLLPFMPHPYTLASYGRVYVRFNQGLAPMRQPQPQ